MVSISGRGWASRTQSTKMAVQQQSDRSDLYGGIALALATLSALIVANSPFGPDYRALLAMKGQIGIGSILLAKTLEHWINDGLMAIFFLLVGVEIKREALAGELAGVRQAALPIVAAIGGFVVPALIYEAVTWGDAQAMRGWAIASATDIAFAVAVCAALGRFVPPSLRTFLLALAIIDDLLAIVVIAIFYTSELSALSLALAAVGIFVLVVLNILNVQRPSFYLIAGLFTWVCVLKSGVHATLAGVAVGLALPFAGREDSLLVRTEHALKPWVAYAIVPIFAFANAGVPLGNVSFASLTAPIPLAIIAGLFLGKQLGVFGTCIAATKLGIATVPAGVGAAQLYGVAILTGIGFTMSLFIGTLAYEDAEVLDQIRVGVLVASLLSATVGSVVLVVAGRRAA
jgi:Na+:H+ antiporter, NhaA family